MTVAQVVRLPPDDKWTHALLDRIFDGTLWPVPGVEYELHSPGTAARGEPCVVVVPGEEWSGRIVALNRYLSRFSRVLVVIVADEGSTFPHLEIVHPDMRLWIQTPRPGIHAPGAAHYFGFGYHYDTPDTIAGIGRRVPDHEWFFSGQITHARRRELVDALEQRSDNGTGGVLIQTQGFAEGMPRHAYLEEIVRARWVPCPSGPVCPDSFRLYETLEAGRIPYVDAECPGYPAGVTGRDYWDLVYGPDAGLLGRIDDWSELVDIDPDPMWGPILSAWWQGIKRATAWRMRDDSLGLPPAELVRGITVVITTSPIPSCPATYHLDRTLDSIRERLPDAEVIVTADGWRDGAPCSREAYVEYLDAIAWRSAHEWRGVLPLLSGFWIHQANTTRRALELVRTSTVLFAEHDTPLCGPDLPWRYLVEAVESGEAHVVRLSSEETVLHPWRYLYLEPDETRVVAGVPMLRTVQWSSRPHLTSTTWYRELLDRYFADESRTYTEDVLHRVIRNAWDKRGEAAWDEWRLWTYAPDLAHLKRSTHTDGRDGVSKGRLLFAYPGGHVPEGAPRPWAGGAPA